MSFHMIPVESMLDIIFPYDICIRFVSKMDNFILIIFFPNKKRKWYGDDLLKFGVVFYRETHQP